MDWHRNTLLLASLGAMPSYSMSNLKLINFLATKLIYNLQ